MKTWPSQDDRPTSRSVLKSARCGHLDPAMPLLIWRILGFTSVGIGIINAFIPLMPTTVFLLVGAWALGKGSPVWRAKLLAHPKFGRALRDWEDGKRVSRRGKHLAAAGMLISWVILLIWRGFNPWTIGVGALLAAIAIWLWTRPEPREGAS